MADATKWIIQMIKENPEATVIGIGGAAKISNLLIIDAYSPCPMWITALQAVFTFGLFAFAPILLSTMSWQDHIDWFMKLLTQLVALGVSGIGLYALVKKTFRNKRRNAIKRRRKTTNN